MTSPSMKSAEKKTPEKKPRSSSESDIAPDTADQETPRVRFDLNAFAWMRIFRFSNLLVRQG
jgi:hypothetical protein